MLAGWSGRSLGRSARAEMALLQSCCCWHSLRKGSYASAIYTMAYFSFTLLIMAVFLHEERQVLAGQENGTDPYESTILEAESITDITMVFNILVIACSVLGLVSSTLLVYGIYSDKKQLLVPWIAAVVLASIVDVSHVTYLIWLELRNFNPMTAIVFTLDFFLISFNIYSLLCVVSQYQEYRAGRGTAQQHRLQFPAAKVRYVSKPDLWPDGREGREGRESRGRVRGLSLVPTPTAGPPGGGLGGAAVGATEPPLTFVSPAQCSPSACLLDPAQSHSPRSLSPGPGWPMDPEAASGPAPSVSRSPSVRKHVQFNQAEPEPALAASGPWVGAGPWPCQQQLGREGSFKGQPSGRRRSAIQRAPLPEESSLELAEGTSADAEVEVVELLGPAPPIASLSRCPALPMSLPAINTLASPAPASHTATGAWLSPPTRVHCVGGSGSGGNGNGLAT